MRPLWLIVALAACHPEKPDDSGTPAHDRDADGHVDIADGGDDCDDNDASIHPEADERCDGVDNDCDGATDEDDAVDASTWYADSDGDPGSATVACTAPTGFVADDTDCDDSDAPVFPGGEEICNDGKDGDCDGDLGPCSTSLADADLTLTGAAAGNALGTSVSLLGDLDGDG